MARTTTTEVRKNEEEGRLYVWAITTSDVDGESGAIRQGPIDRPAATEQILKAERDLQTARDHLADCERKLAYWEDVKAQVVAIEAAPA